MLKLDIPIQGSGWIAPQAPASTGLQLAAQEPDYSRMIAPMQLRRMSKAVRLGIGAAKACLADAGVETPDGIATGTGLGCLQDTEVFLKKLVEQDEQMLTPTAFIQSTHNTVAGQIALLSRCHGFNTTVSQQGHSFEGAFVSTAMHLAANPGQRMLCGGVDELSPTAFSLMRRAGAFTHTSAGEGAGFLLLGGDPSQARVRVTGLHQFHAGAEAAARILAETVGNPEGAALWTGRSGNTAMAYDALTSRFADKVTDYKQLHGDWPTAVAVALAKAVSNWNPFVSGLFIVSNFGRDWSVWRLEHRQS